MLLNILQYEGPAPITKNYLALSVNSAKDEKPCSNFKAHAYSSTYYQKWTLFLSLTIPQYSLVRDVPVTI